LHSPRRRSRPGSAPSGSPPPGANPDAPAGGRRALFLGSSLTYANDMPFLVQALAQSVGETLDVAVVGRGGASLEDHWNKGEARTRIREGRWDFVVLQQGPSSLPESRANLREFTKRFAEPIRKIGARPALYMVWPSADRLAFFDEVRTSYERAAEDVNGMLLPAGEAWQAVWRRDPNVTLFRRDGVHPSPIGSFTVALSIFGMLYDRSLVGLPERVRLRNGAHAQVPAELAPLLQEAATEANAQYGRR
jgi:hypothetical protein